jgi:hypothetical protein
VDGLTSELVSSRNELTATEKLAAGKAGAVQKLELELGASRAAETKAVERIEQANAAADKKKAEAAEVEAEHKAALAKLTSKVC